MMATSDVVLKALQAYRRLAYQHAYGGMLEHCRLADAALAQYGAGAPRQLTLEEGLDDVEELAGSAADCWDGDRAD
jgi:hypothetical protein